MKIKRAASALLCMLLSTVLLLLTGCGSEKMAALIKYSLPEEFDKLQTTCVAENTRYSLLWDAKSSRVIMYDKIKDCEWSYVPRESLDPSYDEEGYEATNHPRIESPVIVKYYTATTKVDNETNAYAQSINKGDFTLRRIDGGIEMMCYFDKFQFAVPISFVLGEDGLDISVDVDRIEEGSEYCISAITIAPFFCSISNKNAEKDGYYMFMPSGSGTVIYPDNSNELGISTSEPVYGGDANIEQIEQTTVTETVRMPIYGVVNGDNAVLAVIKSGSESAYINTMMGQALTGYSYITSEFKIRGYQTAVQTLFTSNVVKTNLYADGFTPNSITVGFYPLYDDDANYVGMAKKYRDYLSKEGKLGSGNSDDTLLNLKIYGGILTKKFTFGIPSSTMLTATTVSEAQNMVKELYEATGVSMNTNLIGFGGSGNDIGKVAGGYKLNSAFGKKSELKSFSEYCNANGISLFMNFDMVRFRSSGGGVSKTFGRATSANGSFTTKHYFDMNFRVNSTTLSPYYLVSRSELFDVADNIEDAAANFGLSGVSLDTLTSIVYSDYSDKAYYSGSNTAEQVKMIIDGFGEKNIKVAGSDANAFAAGLCAHVYDVPTRSSLNRLYSYDVPFYEIVFKGSVSMSSTSLNLATDERTTLLTAAESGLGLTYSLIGEYDTNLISSAQNVFYGSLYWDDTINRGVKTDVIETVNEYKAYFESVKNAKITDHEIINKNVKKTVFDNGITVYVNYGETEYSDGTVKVPARDYITVKGA